MNLGGRRAAGELGLLALFAGLLALLVASVATAAPRAKLSKDLTDAVAAGHGGDVIFQADRATVEAVASGTGRWWSSG